jgi:hypothetical protein
MKNSMTCVLTKYYSDDDIKVVRWVEHVARMGEKRNAYRVLEMKAEGNIHF